MHVSEQRCPLAPVGVPTLRIPAIRVAVAPCGGTNTMGHVIRVQEDRRSGHGVSSNHCAMLQHGSVSGNLLPTLRTICHPAVPSIACTPAAKDRRVTLRHSPLHGTTSVALLLHQDLKCCMHGLLVT